MGIAMSKKKTASSKSKKKQQPPPKQTYKAQAAPPVLTTPPPPSNNTAPSISPTLQDAKVVSANLSLLPGEKAVTINRYGRQLTIVTDDKSYDYYHGDPSIDLPNTQDGSADTKQLVVKKKQKKWEESATSTAVPNTEDGFEQGAIILPPTHAAITTHCGSADDDAMSNPSSVFSRNGSRVSSDTSSSSSNQIITRAEMESRLRYDRIASQGCCEIDCVHKELAALQEECKKHHPTGGNVKHHIEVNGTDYDCWDEAVDDLCEQLDIFVDFNYKLEAEKKAANLKFIKMEVERNIIKEHLRKMDVSFKKLEGQKTTQDQKVRDLKGTIEKSAGQTALLEKLEGKLITAESHKANLDHKLQASIAECNTLREQMKVTQQKWEEATAELAKVTESTAGLQREIRVVENERISLAKQLKVATAARTLANNELAAQAGKKDPESIKEIASLNLKIQKLERKCGNREQEIKILEEEITSANCQQAEMTQEIEGRNEKLKLLEDEIETIKVLRVNQKQPNKNQIQDIGQLKSQLKALQVEQEKSNTTSDHQIELLKSQLLAAQQKSDELQRACETRETTIQFADRRQEGFERLCAELQEACGTRDGEIGTFKARVQNLESQRDTNNAREAGLVKDQLEASNIIKNNNKMITNLKRTIASQFEELKYRGDQLQQLDGQPVEDKDITIRALEQQLQASENARQELLQQLQDLSQTYKTQSISLQKRFEQQWAQSTTLRRQFEKLSDEHQTQDQEVYYLRGGIQSAKYRCSDLENQVSYLQSSNNQALVDGQSTPENIDDGAIVFQNPPTENGLWLLYQDHKSCQTTIHGLQDQLNTLTQKHVNVVANSSVAKKDQFKAAIHQTALISELRNRIFQLQLQQDSTSQESNSFAKCAIDVRLGFLEHARSVIHNDRTDDESREVRVNAKIATHCANGQLDADILTHSSLPRDLLISATETFTELYSTGPSRYGEWGAKAKRLVDCQATLKCIPVDEGLGLERGDLEEYGGMVERLAVLRDELGDEGFEGSEEVEALVGRVEYLTGMVVALRV